MGFSVESCIMHTKMLLAEGRSSSLSFKVVYEGKLFIDDED
jgi:hypothetical protein